MTTSHAAKAQNDAADTVWLTDEEQKIWREWLLVTRRMEATLARELQQDSSISYPDYAVLVNLSEHPEGRFRIAALAESLDWDRSRLSHQITRMAKRGLVRRETCSHDGRGAFVAIEDEGRKIIAEAAPGHVRSVRNRMFDLLGAQDRKDLRRILDVLATQFSTDNSGEATSGPQADCGC